MRSFISSELFKILNNLPRVIQQVNVKLYLDSGLAPSPRGGQKRGDYSQEVGGPLPCPSPGFGRGAVHTREQWFHQRPHSTAILSPHQDGPSTPDTLRLGLRRRVPRQNLPLPGTQLHFRKFLETQKDEIQRFREPLIMLKACTLPCY